MRRAAISIVALLASAAAGQTAWELPRPTSLTITNALVECADAAGCVVQWACGVPTTAFTDSDFTQVGNPLAEGETLETPRVHVRTITCAVRVVRDDGTQNAAAANVVGLRYAKLRQANDSFHVAGVAEAAVHRARTVASVVRTPGVDVRDGLLLDWLIAEHGYDVQDMLDRECGHIRDGATERRRECEYPLRWRIGSVVAIASTEFTRCVAELAIEWEKRSDHDELPEVDVLRQTFGLLNDAHIQFGLCEGHWGEALEGKRSECCALYESLAERFDVD